MSLFRLDSVSPALADHFRRASPARRREAALVACRHAAATAGLAAREADEALSVLRGESTPDESLRRRLEALAARFDDEHFRLKEDGGAAHEQEALRVFSMARATSALAFALQDDEAGLHEAIYEAIAALDTPDELERLVGAALGASAAPKSAEEIQGLELDWLGSDADGHVALFSTAGVGFAPAEFLRDTDAHDEAIDVVLALPASTAAKFAPAVAPGLTNTWRLVAERGLYAFDCDPNGGPYCLVAAPVVPIRVDALPSTAAGVVARIRLGLRFEIQTVVADDLLKEAR